MIGGRPLSVFEIESAIGFMRHCWKRLRLLVSCYRSVRLSVSMSRSCIVLKRQKISTQLLLHTISSPISL